MPLAEGARLEPYEILSALGAGGMGEVYKARDTRLDRDVALKVLPQHLSKDSALRRRFEREAKTLAGLHHPNICSVHDVGREGDTGFLVMEYLEGRTLADRLKSGPLPLDEALRGAPQRLFLISGWDGGEADNHVFTASRDGRRFLTRTRVASKGGGDLTVVVNWQRALKK